ncbi:MAG: alpha/beta hydrolase [Bifidobacteriaceae bacterium]|jgi:pimeloyl-ACP methyl ester carboxylesterase|nr:alpha/beta hydrolase [Bifidobacteriaceae bacterium]
METKSIERDGVKLVYAVHGEGRPIVLAHGNGETHKIFDDAIQKLADKGFKVIAPDTRGHGESGNVERLYYTDIAEDYVKIIEAEKLQKPIFCGFSDGGIVGLLIAIKHPDLLDKLITCGANLNPFAIKPFVQFAVKVIFFFTRNDKFRMMLEQPDIKPWELEQIKVPAVIINAEKDVVLESHARLIAQSIPDAELVLVPNEKHQTYVLDNEKFLKILEPHI